MKRIGKTGAFCRKGVCNTTLSVSSMLVLPSIYYGDPSNCIDALRRARKRAMRDRKHKSARIQALTKQAIKGKNNA